MNDAARVRRDEDVERLGGDGEHDLRLHPRPESVRERVHGLPVQELHHEERRAVLGHVVVEDRDRPGMTHRVRDVPLAQKARAQVVVEGELGVEYLHRESFGIAVRRSVNRRHAPRPEEPFELVLLSKRLPQARAGPRVDLVLRLRHSLLILVPRERGES